MMLQVLLNDLFCDVTRAPRAVAYGPEVSSPVALFQVRKFLLQFPRGSAFKPFYQLAYRLRRWVLDVHVDVVFADDAFKNPHILCIAYLDDQFSTTCLYFAS